MQGAKYLYLSYGTNTLPNLLYLTLPYLIVLYDRTCRTASCVICYLLSYVIGETTERSLSCVTLVNSSLFLPISDVTQIRAFKMLAFQKGFSSRLIPVLSSQT